MDALYDLQLIILIICGIFIHMGKGQYDNIKLLDNLTSIPSIEEFVNKYVRFQGQPLNFTTISVSDDGTTDKIVVSGGETPMEFAAPDSCGARLTSIPVLEPHQVVDPRDMIFPKCTKAMRCVGCTTKSFRSCQPLEISLRKVQILKLRLPTENADHFDYMGNSEITVEDHVSCLEQCIVKREDCNSKQIYIENDCVCRCKEHDECPMDQNKRWNGRTCGCECIEEISCDGYSIFNRDTCQCEMRLLVGEISQEEIDEFINNALNNGDTSSVSASTTPSTESTTTESTTTSATPSSTTTTTSATASTTTSATTTATTTTTSTTTSTTTTQAPVNTTPCSMKDCGPGWIGVLTNTGVCDCMPDFGLDILLRRKKSIYRRRRRHGKN